MSRRRAREAAMQALFQLDMNPPPEGGREEWKRALDAAWEDGATEQANEKRRELTRLSKEWKVPRMAGIDRSVLRLAVYELRNNADVTPGIVINEAVELAKKFGTDDSGRFVNGVLGSMMREEK